MIAKKALSLPLKGLRFALKSGDTLVKTASTQVTRFKTRFDENKAKNSLDEMPVAKRNYASASEQTELPTDVDSIDMREFEFTKAPINWIPATILVATPIAAAIITPWYLFTHQVSAPVWGVFGAFMVWTGISITAGYHRLLSHRAYKA
ncbi:MAG TPA: fatty acid desaturase, partial [Psychrobacter sp.]|nr:fatty acid desaturase [Psychrobacter sp.]